MKMLDASNAPRPTGRYCQMRLTKRVGPSEWWTVRWVPERIAVQGRPIGFRTDRTGEWSDGWSAIHPTHVVERTRVHASWDERRISPNACSPSATGGAS